MKPFILHIITDLDTGGAEIVLYRLLASEAMQQFSSAVVCLKKCGKLGDAIRRLGIPVYALRMEQPLTPFPGFWRLLNLISSLRPSLIQSWMYHANMAALLATKILGKSVPLVWSIRQSLYDFAENKWSTRRMILWGGRFSCYPAKIVYPAYTSADHHENLGYCRDKRVVIPNGFDTERFVPSAQARVAVRDEWRLPGDTFLIGMVARYHPVKDHATFLKAAGLFHRRHPQVHFLMAGTGVDSGNRELLRLIDSVGLEDSIHLAGERHDIPNLLVGLDVVTSSSYGEAFPNVVGEAMACGVPSVATDVGDTARLLGTTGLLVPPRNSESLVEAWEKILALTAEARQTLGMAARARIIEIYDLPRTAQTYASLYIQLCGEN